MFVEIGLSIVHHFIPLHAIRFLQIHGQGLFKIDGGGKVRCLNITGESTKVRLVGLTITNGFVDISKDVLDVSCTVVTLQSSI